MTTIAWDGTTLAADKQSSWGGTPVPTTKVFKLQAPDGSYILYGGAGHSMQLGAFHRWLRGETTDKPTLLDVAFLMIDSQRRVWMTDQTLNWATLNKARWALGSGADYALGAMEAGATASEAIEIASRLDASTGLGVDCVWF
jgi:hypothetical protein